MTSIIRNPISYKNNNNKTKFAQKILLIPHKITNKQTNSTKKTKGFKHQWRERERERVLTCDRRRVPTSGATQNHYLREKMTERGRDGAESF